MTAPQKQIALWAGLIVGAILIFLPFTMAVADETDCITIMGEDNTWTDDALNPHHCRTADGKTHGKWTAWVKMGSDFIVWTGNYVDGKRQGRWERRTADGGIFSGPMVDDKQHGPWIHQLKNGIINSMWRNGKRHGVEIRRFFGGDCKKHYYENDALVDVEKCY